MHHNAFGGLALPGPAGSYSASPDPLPLLGGRKGGNGKERVGIEKERKGVKEGSREGRAPLTQIPGSAPGSWLIILTMANNTIFSRRDDKQEY